MLLLAGFINHAQVTPNTEKPVDKGGDITIDSYVGELDNDSLQIYNYASLEVKPQFPGGEAEFIKQFNAKIDLAKFKDAAGKTLNVYANFIVEKDGSITAIKILRDPGYGIAKETEQVVKNIKTKWTPGMYNGKPIRTNYIIKLTIVVPGNNIEKTIDTNNEPVEAPDNSIYNSNTLQVQPEFPGGQQMFVKFISNNIKKENLGANASDKEIKVFIQFIVEKDGTVTNHKIVEAPTTTVMKEVLRVLAQLKTKWNPGIINSKPVRALYSTQVVIKVP